MAAEEHGVDELEQLELERAARKEATQADRKAQLLIDKKAFFALEEELGDATVKEMNAPGFVKGLPVLIVLRTPTGAQYKRFQDQIAKANTKQDVKSKREAQDLLATSCWVYPKEKETREALLESFPALLVSIAIEANKLAEFRTEEEGKG